MGGEMSNAEFFYNDINAPFPNKPIHVGACAIIICEKEMLLEKRADSNTWALVGGGINMDESLEECILREISEETGLNILKEDLDFIKVYSDPSRIAKYPDGNVLRIITAAYLVRLKNRTELIRSDESLELRFFNLPEVLELKIAATHRHIIKEFLDVSCL